jgi:alpha-galactosidase
MALEICPNQSGLRVWTWGASAGANYWRWTNDMRDSWQFGTSTTPAVTQNPVGVLDGINLAASLGTAPYNGSGHWNDPDMIMAGNNLTGSAKDLGATGLNHTQEQTQVSMWAMFSAPLILGSDIRQMDPASPSYSASFASTYGPMLENNEINQIDGCFEAARWT